jgi:hypothetical protein
MSCHFFLALSVLIKSVEDKVKELVDQKIAVQKQLEDAELLHAQNIENLTRDKTLEYESLIEQLRSELVEKHTTEIDRIVKEHEEKITSLFSTSQMSQDEIGQVIETFLVGNLFF